MSVSEDGKQVVTYTVANVASALAAIEVLLWDEVSQRGAKFTAPIEDAPFYWIGQKVRVTLEPGEGE